MRLSLPAHLACTALLLACGFARPNQAAELERAVVFRDGTLLKVQFADEALPWRRMTEDGRVFEEPVKLGEITRLRLVRTPATDQVAIVRRLASQLGDVDFHKREAAQAELVKIGGKFRNILLEYVARTTDMEEKWRLGVLLKSLPSGQGLIDADYDLLTLPGAEKLAAGDVASWAPVVKYRGTDIKLDRASVAALGEIPLLPMPAGAAAAAATARTRRIEANDDRLFPAQVTRVEFEKGPRGEELSDERDIATVFAPLGCTFAVSIPNSFISVQSYNVGGRSGGKCAAGFAPRYQGTMTIRFCVPEFDRIPAGVTHVGLSCSHVAPGGTGLVAYDAFDRKLGEVWTTRTGTDFIALQSNVPIAYVNVTPNDEIDKDFAIDDLVFDTPRPLAEIDDAEKYGVLLASGERLYCEAVETAASGIVLKRLSIGVPELKLSAEEIAVVNFPKKLATPFAEPAADCFVRIADGCLLRVSADGRLKSSRFPKLALKPEDLVALWGSKSAPDMPDDDAWGKDVGAVLVERDKPVKALGKWKLAENWLLFPDNPFGAADFTYANAPPVWLQKPPAIPEGSGLVRLRTGEELVLNSMSFALKQWSGESAIVVRGGVETTIPASEVASVVFPQKLPKPRE